MRSGSNISSQSPPNDRGKWWSLMVAGGQSDRVGNPLHKALYQVICPGREPIRKAPPVGIEPTTCGLGNRCSIRLSYGSEDGAKSGAKLVPSVGPSDPAG